jgi:hypothetical protein
MTHQWTDEQIKAMDDALRWGRLVAPHGLVVIHDTGGWQMGCAGAPRALRDRHGWDVLNFPTWADGFAITR